MSMFDIDIIGFRYDSETVRIVFWVRFHVGLRLLKPELLDEGGKEDEEGVLGQALPHADSPTKSKRNKLLLLDQADTSITLL